MRMQAIILIEDLKIREAPVACNRTRLIVGIIR